MNNQINRQMDTHHVNNITTNINLSRVNPSMVDLTVNNSQLFKKTTQVRKFDAYQFFKAELATSHEKLTDDELERVISYKITFYLYFLIKL
jgi:hypothetical protein